MSYYSRISRNRCRAFASCAVILLKLSLYADVDVSFLVADVKYSRKEGVKICEIQHGVDSIFKGDAYSHGGTSLIAKNFVDFFARYEKPSWAFVFEVVDPLIRNDRLWIKVSNAIQLKMQADFKEACEESVLDPDAIKSYNGFIIGRASSISDSIISVDRALLPIRRDKYAVSSLLDTNKPEWRLYPKELGIAKRILEDFRADRFVIKPRGEFCGKGVVMVDREHLDETISYIFTKSDALKNDPDRAYSAWYKEQSDTFIIEAFALADPVVIEEKEFCPTIRVAFIAYYEKGRADICFLGGYYCLPEKSLLEAGSLHEKYKSSLQVQDSAAIDQDIYLQVTQELYRPLLHFYEKVLEIAPKMR